MALADNCGTLKISQLTKRKVGSRKYVLWADQVIFFSHDRSTQCPNFILVWSSLLLSEHEEVMKDVYCHRCLRIFGIIGKKVKCKQLLLLHSVLSQKMGGVFCCISMLEVIFDEVKWTATSNIWHFIVSYNIMIYRYFCLTSYNLLHTIYM